MQRNNLQIVLALAFISFSHALMLDLPEGAKCEENWVCSRTAGCASIFPLAVSSPKICSFVNQFEPIYCCPPSHNFINPLQIENQCNSYTLHSCILRSRRFISSIFSFPSKNFKANLHKHMALVGFGRLLDEVHWSCAGSVISPNFILSAAHCAVDTNGQKARWVRVGDLELGTDEDGTQPQNIRITQRIIHPNYTAGSSYHDIALFKLERNIIFDKWVAPLCLYYEEQIETEKAIVSGWGKTGFVEARSKRLLAAQIPVIPAHKCKSILGVSKMLSRGVDTETMICAGEQDGGKDACQGDSGGPLMVGLSSSCLKYQIGVTSMGRMCGLPNQPGVYTRIFPYLPWIQNIVWPVVLDDLSSEEYEDIFSR